MKKFLAVFISFIFIIGVVGCAPDSVQKESPSPSSAPVSPAASDADWKTLYTEFILAADAYLESYYPDALYYINVTDLTLDGVPELIVSDTAASAAACFAVFQIIGNTVQPIEGHSVSGAICSQENTKTGIKSPYAHFDTDWMTLRKNKETGHLQYVIQTHNGSSEESFGEIYGVAADDAGHVSFVELFSYVNYTDEAREDIYTVDGKAVSQEEYDEKVASFTDLWEDTGYVTHGMHRPSFYSKLETYVPLSTEEADLQAFFDMYAPAQL